MNKKLVSKEKGTVITTGKGKNKTVIIAKSKVSSRGKVVGFGNQLDVVFVIDTTGSMEDKIEALLLTCRQFVDEAESLGLDSHFALISFGDISVIGGGDTIELVIPLTSNIERVKYGLSNIPRNNGFGNWGESCLEAIHEAFKVSHREKAVKVMILITDEPALEHNITTDEVIQELREREYLVSVVAIDEPYYKEMALKNGGIWKGIGADTDLSEILEAFREMAKKVSEVVEEVHLLGGGSVKKYLALKAPKDK